jgi:hypothetical protein
MTQEDRKINGDVSFMCCFFDGCPDFQYFSIASTGAATRPRSISSLTVFEISYPSSLARPERKPELYTLHFANQFSISSPSIFSKCFRLLVTRIALCVIAVAPISASTSPVGFPMALSLLFISPNFIAHDKSKGIMRITSIKRDSFSKFFSGC